MALTYTEKRNLREAIYNLAQDNMGIEPFTLKELAIMLGAPYSEYPTASIRAQLGDTTRQVGKKRNANTYTFVKYVDLASFEKNRSVITFYNEDRTVSISYDFATGEIVDNGYYAYRYGAFNNLFNRVVSNELPEWIFSYADLLETDYYDLNGLPTNCPKGFIKYLKDNDLRLNRANLKKYLIIEELGTDNEEIVALADYCTDEEKVLVKKNVSGILYALDHEYLEEMYKRDNSWGRSVKTEVYKLISNYLEICKKINEEPIWKNMLKNYCIAKRKYDLVKNAENDVRVKEWQTKKSLAFENDLFEVIVPTSYAEFQAEANYQQNCVCAYYYPKVAEEQTRVVFVRRKSEPNKPFITCEINLGGSIIQYLTRFNHRVEDESALAFKSAYEDYLETVFG